MRYASEIIGLPVIAQSDGEELETVRNLIYDDRFSAVLAVLVDPGGWFSEAMVIPFESIHAIGSDAVIIPDRSVIVGAMSLPAIAELLQTKQSATGKTVLTEDGTNLGRITDLCLNEASGEIEGFVVSGGIFADLAKGRPIVPSPEVLSAGNDAVFVSADTAQRMEAQQGGLAGVRQSASAQAHTFTATAQRGMQRAVDTLTERLDSVRTEEGTPKTEEQRDDSTDHTSFWDQAKESTAQFTDKVREGVETKQIERALGRPVTRVIYDQDDRIILNTGDLITNSAIDQAREAGVLNLLLSSVSDDEPTFGSDERRA